MRHYFKKHNREDRFFRFCSENGADYIEDGDGIWIIPKKVGEWKMGIRCNRYGQVTFGKIIDSCTNFEPACELTYYFIGEFAWIKTILTKLQEWDPDLK